jgi:hypothetical protein
MKLVLDNAGLCVVSASRGRENARNSEKGPRLHFSEVRILRRIAQPLLYTKGKRNDPRYRRYARALPHNSRIGIN